MFKPVQSSGSYSAIWHMHLLLLSGLLSLVQQGWDVPGLWYTKCKSWPIKGSVPTIVLLCNGPMPAYLHSNDHFQVNLGSPVPPWFSSSTCHEREPLKVSNTGVLQARCFFLSPNLVSKYWSKYIALTAISGLASSFLHQQQGLAYPFLHWQLNFWWKGVPPFTISLDTSASPLMQILKCLPKGWR